VVQFGSPYRLKQDRQQDGGPSEGECADGEFGLAKVLLQSNVPQGQKDEHAVDYKSEHFRTIAYRDCGDHKEMSRSRIQEVRF
jgi:hypothetical protein